ncbi:MAG: hypothetical protein GY716_13225 [bacterium]|nr:hypothetical protein [bacterium]
MWLIRVVEALDRARVAYALVGGYAVALHGAVRGTLDIDLVLRFSEKQFEAAARAFRSLSLEPRLPVTASEVFRFREEYLRNRNLTAWTFVNPNRPSEIVDVVLTHDLSAMKVRRVRVEGRSIKLASIDDLIRMKKASGRPQDLEDVRALERLK